MKEVIENHADQLWAIFGAFAIGFVILTLPMGLFLGYLSKRLAVNN